MHDIHASWFAHVIYDVSAGKLLLVLKWQVPSRHCPFTDELYGKWQRTLYLITYSRANVAIFPIRQMFADAVLQAWALHGVVPVVQWVVSLEGHAECEEEDEINRWYYHMVIKLPKNSRMIMPCDDK